MSLKADIFYALRQMRQSPVFTLATLLTLALGIGATTAIFTLMHAVMLKPLPVADPARLYRIGTTLECCYNGWEENPEQDWSLFSYALYRRLNEAAPEFEQLAAFQAMPRQMSVRRAATEQIARPLYGEFISGNYFSMFGVRAALGRALGLEDDRASAPPVAVLSYHTWQQNYGSDPSILGAVLTIEGQPVTVIGVAPAGFFGDTLRANPPDFWLPLQQEPLFMGQNQHLRNTSSLWLYAIGRLRPGASLATLPARLTSVLHQYLRNEANVPAEMMAQEASQIPRKRITISSASGGVQSMRSDYGESLRLLMIICATVLLIACANVANLLLARSQVRRAQLSLRVALGASRQRLVRQALTESVLLSLLGGLLGVYLAYAGASLILTLAFRHEKFIPIDPTPSWPVLGFAFLLSVVTGILFGTAPAWFASRSDPVEALRGATRTTRDKASSPQKILVITQAALSVVLLAGAGLLTRSLERLQHQDFGLNIDRLISVQFNPPSPNYTPARLDALYRDMEDRLSRLSNVQSVSFALYSPLSQDNWGESVVIEGRPAPTSIGEFVSWDRVSAHFFETVGQSVVRGRAISERDTRSSQPVAVVNESFVRKFFKNENPIGKHFGMNVPAYASSFEIIGVMRDAKYVEPNKPAHAMFFLPLAQWANYRENLLRSFEAQSHFISSAQLRLHGGGKNIEGQVRKTLADIDPNLTIVSFRTMRDQVSANFDRERTVAQLSGLLASLALLLAAVGLYGVTAYAVAVRTNEIGVRMALGAKPIDIVRAVLKGAFSQIAIGLALGIPIAIGAGILMSSQLYQVRSYDPLVLATSIAALGICAFLASIIPARRAAAVDPVKAMRTE